MAGKPRANNDEINRDRQMMELGREDGARQAKRALETVDLSVQLGQISGRAQAFKAMRLIAEFLEWKQVMQIISNKEFLKIPGVTNIGDYLETLGLSRSTVYENLKMARNLTIDDVRFFGQVGFSRKDLLVYASLPDDTRLEIREGKIINLEKASRESIRDLVETLLEEKHQLKEEAAGKQKAADRLIEKKESDIQKLQRENDELTKKVKEKALPISEEKFFANIELFRTTFRADFDTHLDPDLVKGLQDEDNPPTPRMISAYIGLLHETLNLLSSAYKSATLRYGELEDLCEERWEYGKGMALMLNEPEVG